MRPTTLGGWPNAPKRCAASCNDEEHSHQARHCGDALEQNGFVALEFEALVERPQPLRANTFIGMSKASSCNGLSVYERADAGRESGARGGARRTLLPYTMQIEHHQQARSSAGTPCADGGAHASYWRVRHTNSTTACYCYAS